MLQLPNTIKSYFEASNAQNLTQIMACFDKNAIVKDVGENLEMKGIASIQKWVEALIGKYDLRLKPLKIFIS